MIVVPVMVDHAYSYDVEATDADGDPIEYTLEIAPTGMTINAASGVIAWAPTVTEVGEHTVTVKAADNRGAYATQSYTLFVTEEPNNAPQITTTPGYGVTISQLYRYDVNAIDPNGDPIQYSLETAPVGMTIDPLSGLIEWTPSATAVGQHAIAVKAADDRGAYAIQSYTLVVTAQPNDPPVITTTPDFAATVDQPYSYDVDAGDPDGDLMGLMPSRATPCLSPNNPTPYRSSPARRLSGLGLPTPTATKWWLAMPTVIPSATA